MDAMLPPLLALLDDRLSVEARGPERPPNPQPYPYPEPNPQPDNPQPYPNGPWAPIEPGTRDERHRPL